MRRNLFRTRSGGQVVHWWRPIAELVLLLAVSSGCVIVPEGNLGTASFDSCPGGSCQCGDVCDGSADCQTGNCSAPCNNGGCSQSHEAMPALWSPLLTACAIP